MCLYPKILRNKKYAKNVKNGGIIPTVHDGRVLHIAAGCGNCKECRKAYARNWQVRLLEDIKENKNGKFITLTLSTKSIKELIKESIQKIDKKTKEKHTIQIENLEGYEKDNAIATIAVRRFVERWRKEYGKSIRHWLITELGHKNTEHVHLHGIIWTDKTMNDIERHWKYGFIWKGEMKKGRIINYVNESTVNYIIKYVHKIDFIHKTYKPKVLTSSGIGAAYINKENIEKNKYNNNKTDETYRTRTGHKISLPIYWRNKLYNEEEREKLWIKKLDEEIRWINGQKIDISKGDKEYYKILKHAQKQNKELGYGTNKIEWSRAEYERIRRNAIYKYRTK